MDKYLEVFLKKQEYNHIETEFPDMPQIYDELTADFLDTTLKKTIQ